MDQPAPKSKHDNEFSRQVDKAIKRLEERGFFTDIEATKKRKFMYGRFAKRSEPEQK